MPASMYRNIFRGILGKTHLSVYTRRSRSSDLHSGSVGCASLRLGISATVPNLLSRSLSALQSPADDGIYELRTYSIKPDRYAEFLKHNGDNIHFRYAHSEPLWYWQTELGGLNEVMHLWHFDSYAHRSSVRQAISKDEPLISTFMSGIVAMVAKQDNMILLKCPWYDLNLPTKSGGVFEMNMYKLKNGKYDTVAHRIQQGLDDRMKYSKPVGFWLSEVGLLSRFFILWHYENADERAEIRRAAYADEVWKETVRDVNVYVEEASTKILTSTSFSPRT